MFIYFYRIVLLQENMSQKQFTLINVLSVNTIKYVLILLDSIRAKFDSIEDHITP